MGVMVSLDVELGEMNRKHNSVGLQLLQVLCVKTKSVMAIFCTSSKGPKQGNMLLGN